MSDIDFDELDKAVNSLMNQRTEPGSVDLPIQPASTSAQDSFSPTPQQSLVSEVSATSSGTPQPTTIVRRSTGKYMDMVSPAARSRSAPVKQDAIKPVSRDNGSIQPTQPASMTSPYESQVATSVESETVDQTSVTLSTPEPMQSPFLSDIAVDKRPLGSQDPTTQDNWNIPDFTEETSQPTATEEQAAPESKPTATPDAFVPEPAVVPPELSADVLALESDVNASNSLSAADAEHVKKVENNPPRISSPGDIVPQYSHEAANSPEPSAVFDAASDVPKQLDHPERKKSGWMIFVWILILVIVGAGGGVAAWYFLAK